MLSLIQKFVTRLARIPFVRTAMATDADLRVFRQPPTPRVIFGLVVIAISYLIGWPLIGLLGLIAVHLSRSGILLVGGPVAYGISHLVFIVGAVLAGAHYSKALLCWLTRLGMRKLMALTGTPMPVDALPASSDPA